MKKPDIRITDEWSFHMSVIQNNDSLFPQEIKLAYEGMIDALIEAREFILNQGPVEKYDFKTLGIIEGALKKAGCEL